VCKENYRSVTLVGSKRSFVACFLRNVDKWMAINKETIPVIDF